MNRLFSLIVAVPLLVNCSATNDTPTAKPKTDSPSTTVKLGTMLPIYNGGKVKITTADFSNLAAEFNYETPAPKSVLMGVGAMFETPADFTSGFVLQFEGRQDSSNYKPSFTVSAKDVKKSMSKNPNVLNITLGCSDTKPSRPQLEIDFEPVAYDFGSIPCPDEYNPPLPATATIVRMPGTNTATFSLQGEGNGVINKPYTDKYGRQLVNFPGDRYRVVVMVNQKEFYMPLIQKPEKIEIDTSTFSDFPLMALWFDGIRHDDVPMEPKNRP